MDSAPPTVGGGLSRRREEIVRDGARPGDTGGELIYAIGDIHGCYQLMIALLAFAVEDSLERAGARRPVLVFCGDYIDRGPDSAKVLEALTNIQGRADLDLHLLKGNHEQALLGFIDNPLDGGMWLQCGGCETLQSYGVTTTADAGPRQLVLARDKLLGRMPASHLLLLQRLKLMVTAGDYAFVHAGIRPGVALARQTEQDLLWIRKGFVDAPGPFEKIIVHGHTWIGDQPDIQSHRIGVDTGAYVTGALTAVRFDAADVAVIQARCTPATSMVLEVSAPVGTAA